MTSQGPPTDAGGDGDENGRAIEGESRALEGEIVGPADAAPVGRDRPPTAVPAIPVVLVNPQHLTGATPGNPPHLGPLTEPKDEPGGAGMPVDPYHGKDPPAPPRSPTSAIGAFPFHVKAPDAPTDPIVPYLSAPVKRGRRSEWPVMVFVMVVIAIILFTCCIGGYGLFFRTHLAP